MTHAIDRSLCECKNSAIMPDKRHCNNVATMIVVRENGQRELVCERCTSSTDVLTAHIADVHERPPARDLSQVRLGTEHHLGGKLYKVVEICEEPNTGLVIVEEIGHSLSWRFQIPALWLVRDPAAKTEVEVKLDEFAAACGFEKDLLAGPQLVGALQRFTESMWSKLAEKADQSDSERIAMLIHQNDALVEANELIYAERDHCVAALMRAWRTFGITVGITEDPNAEDEWKHVVVAEIPTGQVSWHVHDDELSLFEGLTEYTRPREEDDPSTTYERLLAYVPPPAPQLEDELLLAVCKNLHCGGASIMTALEILWNHVRRADAVFDALASACPNVDDPVARVRVMDTVNRFLHADVGGLRVTLALLQRDFKAAQQRSLKDHPGEHVPLYTTDPEWVLIEDALDLLRNALAGTYPPDAELGVVLPDAKAYDEIVQRIATGELPKLPPLPLAWKLVDAGAEHTTYESDKVFVDFDVTNGVEVGGRTRARALPSARDLQAVLTHYFVCQQHHARARGVQP